MGLDTQDLWAIYAEAISQAAGLPNSPDDFILTGSSLKANLATGSIGLANKPSTKQALYEIYTLANTAVHQNGIYNSAESLFFNDYANYIDNLSPKGEKTPTPTQEAKIRFLKAQLTKANKNQQADYASAFAAWKKQQTYFPGKYPDFNSFLNQTPWGQTLNTDNSHISGINSQLDTIMIAVYGQDYVAIQNNKQVVNQVRNAMNGTLVSGPADMEVAASSGDLIVPTYNPSSLTAFSTWVDSTIDQHGSAEPAQVAFSSDSAHYDFSKSTYFSHTDWSTNFFFFSAGGSSTTSRNQIDVDTNSSSFSLTFAIDSITQVDLDRGPWYDSSLMYAYKNPDNLATPTTLYVGMYPKIVLTMDEASYNSAYSSYTSSRGFGVGVFWVAGGGSGSSESDVTMSANWDSSSHTVTIQDESIEPVILGMQVAQVDDGE